MKHIARLPPNGSVELYTMMDIKRFETTSGGIEVTGHMMI